MSQKISFFGQGKDINDPSASQMIKRFATNSSIHGINYIVTTKLKLCTAFWVLACIAASTSFGVQLITLINKYLSNPTRTTAEVTREPADFPDVTICPLRNFDISVVSSLYAQLNLSGSIPEALSLNLSRAEPEFEIPYLRKVEEYFYLWVKYYATNTTLFGTALSRSNMFSNFDLDILKKAMIPPWELTVRCKSRGIKCSPEMISTFYDPYFFRCLTIHASNESSLSEGVESGLAILGIFGSNMVDWSRFDSTVGDPILIAGLQEFNHPLSGDQGARVVIHPPGSKPIPSAEGYNVPPGFSGSLGINIQRTLNLGEPYGKCSQYDYRSGGNETYRLLPCLRRCIYEEVVKQCQCIDTLLPRSSSLEDELLNLTSCGYVRDLPDECLRVFDPPMDCLKPLGDTMTKILYARRVQNEMVNRKDVMDFCQCYTPCDDIKYSIQYSLSQWPPGPEMDSIYVELITEDHFFTEFLKTKPNKIKLDLYMKHFNFANRYKGLKDMAKINVYIADTSIIKTTQEIDYTVSDLLSDLGGIMGLWIGMSVLSIAEILQFACDLFKCLKGQSERVTKRTWVEPFVKQSDTK